MQTSFTPEFLKSLDGQRVDKILRKCVHCGFCNATCPTYQLTGDELDGPRGRIYLIKNFFEQTSDQLSSEVSLKHLDRCLTCLACETTCPSGVQYGELVDIGRKHINASSKRPIVNKLKRKLVLTLFSKSNRVTVLLSLAKLFKVFLPSRLARKIPTKNELATDKVVVDSDNSSIESKLLTIKGCVQNSTAPQINLATKKVLANSNIQLDESDAGCCGALAFHLTELDEAYSVVRKNIDSWYELLNKNYSKLLVNSSGCSSFVKQYDTIMQDDIEYAEKASYISKHCIDLSELATELTPTKPSSNHQQTVAFHSPCTLQHGQQINNEIENVLKVHGYKLVEVQDSHLCCGSAGTYSLLEPELSSQLLVNKVRNLEKNQPDIIATANIGCLIHLQSGTDIPVKHWIELLA